MAKARSSGRPFQKGRSGNPGGLSKEQAAVRQRVRDILSDAAPFAASRLIELMESDNEKIALSASIEVVNRTLGKVPLAQDDTPEQGRVLQLRIATVEGKPVLEIGAEDDDGRQDPVPEPG